MFDFAEQILGYVEMIVDWFFGIIENLILAITFLTTSTGFVTTIAGVMPGIIGSCILMVTAFAILKFIIGR